jgi:hypothetical protein
MVNKGDLAFMRQKIQEGNYEYLSDFVYRQLGGIQVTAEAKRNSLIIEELVSLAKTNGIKEIRYSGSELQTEYQASKKILDPFWEAYANFRKYVNLVKGVLGTNHED